MRKIVKANTQTRGKGKRRKGGEAVEEKEGLTWKHGRAEEGG